MADEPKKKKIIIDEDWKSQVEAEREAAKHKADDAPTNTEQASPEGMSWPEPSLALLITTLATQAMAAMGLMAAPGGDPGNVDLAQAEHFINTIGMLQEKTQGNCTPEEASLLESALHELRMAFVAVQQRGATA
jgi:hypothetical protein